MAGIDDINKADEALKGLSGRLGAMLDGALEKTGTLKDAFAQMKDSVPSDVWDHVNGQLDKTKTTVEEISDIESLRGTSAYESAKSQFSIDQKIQAIAKERVKLMKMRAEMGEDAYNTAIQNLDNRESVLEATKEQWKFEGMVNDKQKEMEKNLVNMGGSMKGLVATAKAFLMTIIANPINVILTVFVGLLALAWAQYQRIDKLTQSLYETTGLTRGQVEQTVGQAQRLQSTFKQMGLELEDVSKTSLAIQSVMGSMNNATDSLVTNIGKMQNQFGIGAEKAAKVTKQLMTMGDGSEKTAFATAQLVKNLSEAAGTDAAVVLDDIANAGAESMKYFAGQPQELAKAATEARRLGLELSVLTGSADKLLNLQSSIEAEYRAEAVLGRNLNVDKVRALMYQGKMVEAGKEILKQAGSLEDFQKLGPIRGKMMAEAYGMTYDQMANMLASEQKMAKWTDEQRASYEKIMSAQEFNTDQTFKQWEAERNRKSDLKSLSDTFDQIKITLGNVLLPYIEKFANYLKDNPDVVNDIAKGVEKVATFLGKAGLFLANNWQWVLAIWGAFKVGGMIKGVMSFTSALGGGAKHTKDLAAQVSQLSKSVKGMPKGGGGGGVMQQVVGKLKPQQILAGGLAMIMLAGAIWIMAKAMQQFSTGVTWSGVLMGIVSMGLLVAAAFALGALMMSGVGALALIAGAAAMVILAGAMWVMGKAMQEFAKAAVILQPPMEALFNGIALIINTIADAFIRMMHATAESFERMAAIGGGQLLATAGGIIAIAGALALFGGGSLISGIGSAIGNFFGGDPVKKFERFAKLGPGLEQAGKGMEKVNNAMPKLSSRIKNVSIDVSNFKMAPMISEMMNAIPAMVASQKALKNYSGVMVEEFARSMVKSIPHFIRVAKAIDEVTSSMAKLRVEKIKTMGANVVGWIADVVTGGVATGGGDKEINVDLEPLKREIKLLRNDMVNMKIELDGRKVGRLIKKYQYND